MEEPAISDTIVPFQESLTSAAGGPKGHKWRGVQQPQDGGDRPFSSISCTDIEMEANDRARSSKRRAELTQARGHLRHTANDLFDKVEELCIQRVERSLGGADSENVSPESCGTVIAVGRGASPKVGGGDVAWSGRGQDVDMVEDAVVLDVGDEVCKAVKPFRFWSSLSAFWMLPESGSSESSFERTVSAERTTTGPGRACEEASGLKDDWTSKANQGARTTQRKSFHCPDGPNVAPLPHPDFGPAAALPSHTAALHRAASMGQSGAVRMLLAARADPSSVAADGATALHRAARYGSYDSVKILLDAGAEQRCDHLGFSALHDASYAGHKQVVRLLLERKGSWTSTGTSPLDLAAYGGHEQVVSELLSGGMWPTGSPAEALRPLQLAAHAGHMEIVKLLLKRLKHFLAEELEMKA